MPSVRDTSTELHSTLESQAIEMVLNLCVDDRLTKAINSLSNDDISNISPWLLCYQALEQRLSQGNNVAALRLAQAAVAQFKNRDDINGYARALTEVAIARYHLGQYATALAEIAACTPPEQPSCVAALAMAAYINHVGINALPEAIRVAQLGLRTLENESNARRNPSCATRIASGSALMP